MTLSERRRQALARLASRRPSSGRPDRGSGWPPEPRPSGDLPGDITAAERHLAAHNQLYADFLEPITDEGSER